MDFTFFKYRKLIEALLKNEFGFQTFEGFVLSPKEKMAVLRHDVDRNHNNAIKMARLEHSLSIKASYYFRTSGGFFNEYAINIIRELGHEIGYHYENMDTCKGNVDAAYIDFCTQLEKLRKLYPVQTFCMHGSPMSPYDNRDLWKKYDYKKQGLIAEPYFDINFNEVFYITDASRAWNNEKVSVRDKVESSFKIRITSLNEIIRLAKLNKLPDKIMLNIHPHNWANSYAGWLKIFLWQKSKNIVKFFLIKLRK